MPLSNLLKKTLLGDFFAKPSTAVQNDLFTRDDLINAESELGRTIFGPIPEGHQREFFEKQKNLWIFYESWTDPASGQDFETTIYYEVRPSGVFKRVFGKGFQKLEGAELENFRRALHAYADLVKTKLYS